MAPYFIASCAERAWLGYCQRAEPKHPLLLDLQQDLAGDEQPHAWRAGHDGVAQLRHRIDQVLGIVECEQHVERLQTGHERRQLMVSARHRQL
jgi:hypothetical protein